MPAVRPAPLGDIGDVVGDVTGFLNNLEQRIHDAETQIEKIKNGVVGGATGAQAGYNAPTNLKPMLIAGGLVLAVVLLAKR